MVATCPRTNVSRAHLGPSAPHTHIHQRPSSTLLFGDHADTRLSPRIYAKQLATANPFFLSLSLSWPKDNIDNIQTTPTLSCTNSIMPLCVYVSLCHVNERHCRCSLYSLRRNLHNVGILGVFFFNFIIKIQSLYFRLKFFIFK